MERILGIGMLYKNFTIYNHVYSVKVPKNTKVIFKYDSEIKAQVIDFTGMPVRIFRQAHRGRFGRWLADMCGRVMTIHFPKGGVPYPVSYFQR